MKDKQILIDYKEYLELERKAEEYKNTVELLCKLIHHTEEHESPGKLEKLKCACLNKKALCELIKFDADTFYFK